MPNTPSLNPTNLDPNPYQEPSSVDEVADSNLGKVSRAPRQASWWNWMGAWLLGAYSWPERPPSPSIEQLSHEVDEDWEHVGQESRLDELIQTYTPYKTDPSSSQGGSLLGDLYSWVAAEVPGWADRKYRLSLEGVKEHCLSQGLDLEAIEHMPLEKETLEWHIQNAVKALLEKKNVAVDQEAIFLSKLRGAIQIKESFVAEGGEVSAFWEGVLNQLALGRFTGSHLRTFGWKLLQEFLKAGLPGLVSEVGEEALLSHLEGLPMADRMALCYVAIENVDRKLTGSGMLQAYRSLCGVTNWGFDGHADGNLPSVLFFLELENGKKIPNLRMGSPTIEASSVPCPHLLSRPQIDQRPLAEINMEWIQYLRALESDPQIKHHCYINLQNRQPRRISDESERCSAIEKLNGRFPEVFTGITLSKDSRFYHQKGGIAQGYPKKVFSEALIQALTENKVSCFYAPDSLSGEVKKSVKKAADHVQKEAFSTVEFFTPEERRNCLARVLYKLTEEVYKKKEEGEWEAPLAVLVPCCKLSSCSRSEFRQRMKDRIFNGEMEGVYFSQEICQPAVQKELEEGLDAVLSSVTSDFFTAEKAQEIEEAVISLWVKELKSQGGVVLSFPFTQEELVKEPLCSEHYSSEIFMASFLDELWGESRGYFLPAKLKTEEMKQTIKEMMEEQLNELFGGRRVLSIQERKEFIELFYTPLIQLFVLKTGATSFNVSCKDCIDRGAAENAKLIWWRALLEGEQGSPEKQVDFLVTVFLYAILVRHRKINHNRLQRLLDAVLRLESRVAKGPLKVYPALASMVRGVEMVKEERQELAPTCVTARSYEEYVTCFEKGELLRVPIPLAEELLEIDQDPSINNKWDTFELAQKGKQVSIPHQFVRDIRSKLVRVNGESFEGELGALDAYRKIYHSLGKGSSKEVRALSLKANQSLLNQLALMLSQYFSNPDLGIGVFQASEEFDPPAMIQILAGEEKRKIQAQGMFKVQIYEEPLLEKYGEAFPCQYLHGCLEIDLDSPGWCTAQFEVMNKHAVSEGKLKDYVLKQGAEVCDKLWVHLGSEM